MKDKKSCTWALKGEYWKHQSNKNIEKCILPEHNVYIISKYTKRCSYLCSPLAMLGPSPFPRSSQSVKAEKTVPRRSDGFTFIRTARMLGPASWNNQWCYAICEGMWWFCKMPRWNLHLVSTGSTLPQQTQNWNAFARLQELQSHHKAPGKMRTELVFPLVWWSAPACHTIKGIQRPSLKHDVCILHGSLGVRQCVSVPPCFLYASTCTWDTFDIYPSSYHLHSSASSENLHGHWM